MDDDIRYLNILAAFHIIVGVIAGSLSCLPLINLSMGLPMLSEIPKAIVQGNILSPFSILPVIFILLPVMVVVVGWMFAIAVALNGYYIKNRKWLNYCIVMSGIETIFMPFGTALGLFSIVLLSKSNVKRLFDLEEQI